MMSDYLEPTYAEISLSRKDLQKKISKIFSKDQRLTQSVATIIKVYWWNMFSLKSYKPNILTAFGIIFLISSAIVPIQNLIVWGPDFVYHFYTSSEITAEKISIGVIILGIIFILLSFKKQIHVEWITTSQRFFFFLNNFNTYSMYDWDYFQKQKLCTFKE